MTSPLTNAIHIKPQTSQILLQATLILHSLSALLIYVVQVYLYMKIVLVILTIVSAIWIYQWHILHHWDGVIEATITPQDHWLVKTCNSVAQLSTLENDSFIQPWLCVLLFRLQDGRKRSLILLPDNIDPTILRRLNIRLRFKLMQKE